MSSSKILRSSLVGAAASVSGIRSFHRSRYAPRLHAQFRDRWNRLRYGPHAPRFAERIWVDPRRAKYYDRKGLVWGSGRVVTGEWADASQKPIEDDPILRASIARWEQGLPWEQTGEIERMERAMARLGAGQLRAWNSREEILRRCHELDEIFNTIQREGRLRTQAEVEPGTFRELGGIGMHLGPEGTPIRAGNGRHRFAMAWILGIRRIPVRIGLVHASALPLLERLRSEE